jgi:hypothetical protein
MTSIITGDIINSRRQSTKNWIDGLKDLLGSMGENPAAWEIYRGDEFQLEVTNPQQALLIAFRIKAYLRTLQLDARMSIGFGDKTYDAGKISESNGSAFVRSGELFELLKKQKITLAISSSNPDFDAEMNLMLRLGLTFMNHWLVQSAEFVKVALENPTASQEEIGHELGINQAAVSRRRKRAQFDLLLDLDAHFRKKIKNINP